MTLYKAMERGDGIYNVASGYEYKLSDMIDVLKTIYDVEVERRDWMNRDVKKFYVDNSRISQLMNIHWTTLKDGIREMMIW